MQTLIHTPFVPRFFIADNYAERVVTIDGGLLDYPITLPGDIRARGNITVHKRFHDTGLRLDVTVEKYIVFQYFALPCMYNVGSWYV